MMLRAPLTGHVGLLGVEVDGLARPRPHRPGRQRHADLRTRARQEALGSLCGWRHAALCRSEAQLISYFLLLLPHCTHGKPLALTNAHPPHPGVKQQLQQQTPSSSCGEMQQE